MKTAKDDLRPQSLDNLFLQGDGEMASRTRAFNWSETEVGAIDTWPRSLLTTLYTILHAKFPMFLWWGPSLTQFYNDAYRPSLGNDGKHPLALGQLGEACWPEIWPIIHPLIVSVLETGKSTWSEDQLVPIYRNGRLENVFWTFSYSPVCDDAGQRAGVLVTCTETTGKVTTLRTLQASEGQYSNLVRDIEVGLLMMRGEEMKVEIVNAAYAALIDRKVEEVLGRPLFDVIPETKPFFYHLLLNVLHTGQEHTMHDQPYFVWSRGTKKEGFVNVIYQPYREANGDVSGVFAFVHDVTQQVLGRRQMETTVTMKTAEVAQSNAHLQEFAYAASHDLKEPVRKIQIFAGKLVAEMSHQVNEHQQWLLTRISDSAAKMGLLIDNLLSFSLLGASFSMEPVNLQHVIAEVIRDLEIRIAEQDALIDIGDLPMITGNVQQLERAFQNILSNGLKFHRPGHRPEITIRSRMATPADVARLMPVEHAFTNFHTIEIRDNGIGFDPEQATNIFKVFTRLHGKADYPGTGIGLAIAKKVANNHNGFVFADGVPGHGSVFTFLFPAV